MTTPHVTRAAYVTILCATLACSASASPPDFSWLPPAPKLPPPAGAVLRVATVDEFFRAADAIQSGGTILLADGHYMMPRYFELRTDGVTLRSASGDRNRVILDGATSRHGELVGVRACSDITIADLTIQNIRHNGFKLNTDSGVHRVTIHNCVIHNIWQRGVKGVRVPKDQPGIRPPEQCRVQHCLFHNDRPKRFSDDPSDTAQTFGGNYLGGIDVMFANGWTICDNVFHGLRGRTGEARGAIFLWHESQGCIVERNVIVDCDTGICLGNSHRGPETKVHAIDCIVRNNFVTRCPENGILADYTKRCQIVHNTIHDPHSRLRRLIRVVHDNLGLEVRNNLLSGPAMRIETEDELVIDGNLTRDAGDWFVDVSSGDLHLAGPPDAIAAAAKRHPRVTHDFDGQPRPSTTTIGADQSP